MRALVLVWLCFGASLSSWAQQHALTKKWDARFGGENFDEPNFCFGTGDHGYLISGSSYSRIGGDKTQDNWDTTTNTDDSWIVKIDSLGNKAWDRRFGGLSDDRVFRSRQAIDGGYILGGVSASGISGDKTEPCWGGFDYWIMKIDRAGNKSWDKRFGGTQDDLLSEIQQTREGGYILGGTSSSESGGDKTQNSWGGADFWVVKIDSLGNKEWDKRFGGMQREALSALVETADGGYLLAGESSSDSGGNKTQASFGVYDFWVLKIDSLGNDLWDAQYGGTGSESVNAMIQTPDGGFVLAGSSSSGNDGDKTQINQGGFDYWLVKIDSLGNKQWDKDYGGTGDDYVYSLILTSDGGYLVGGDSQSSLGGDKTENNIGAVEPWIIKTDSAGNKQWDKTILTNDVTDISNAFQTKDGCYVISGFTSSGIGYYKSQEAWNYSSDYWIVKFCDTLISGMTELTENVNVVVSPNPFATDIAISLQKQGLQQADFTICNMLGQTIYIQRETNLSNSYTKMLDLSYLPNGVYFVEVVVDGERVVREVVKE